MVLWKDLSREARELLARLMEARSYDPMDESLAWLEERGLIESTTEGLAAHHGRPQCFRHSRPASCCASRRGEVRPASPLRLPTPGQRATGRGRHDT